MAERKIVDTTPTNAMHTKPLEGKSSLILVEQEC